MQYASLALTDDTGKLKPVVKMETFTEVFSVVCDFMDSLGAMFGFVSSDIATKLKTLDEVAKKRPSEYLTLQGMVEYEVRNNLARKGWSGCKCMERLLRALVFIVKLLQDLIEAAPDASAATVAVAAYKATLSKHHGWFVRKTVETAMYTLPNRDALVAKLCGPGAPRSAQDAVSEACAVLNKACKLLDEPLSKNDLLNLP